MLRHVLAPVVPSFARHLGVPRTVPGADGVVLSFDDGPHPVGTPAVLEILAQAEMRAVFFLVGEQVEQRPALADRIATAGHAVAVHAHRHRAQVSLPAAAVREDLRRARATVEDATGCQVVLHRPPYGIYSPAGLRAVHEAGLRPLLWSRWGKDWRRFTTSERIARRVLAGVLPGDVILLHDADFYSARRSHERTVAALGPITRELSRRRLATVLPV